MFNGSIILFVLASSLCSGILTGVDRLREKEFYPWIKGKRAGLITNQTGISCNLRTTVEVLHSLQEVELAALFSPEHGISGDAQAGEKVESTIHIHSLYGNSRRMADVMLSGLDVLLFDIQDVGVRFYTYISTMLDGMRAAARNKIPFIVLDRPNPIGGHRVEGPVLEVTLKSFVGIHPIPIRHGMTVGELAKLLNKEQRIEAQLKVVPVKGWMRNQWFDTTSLTWVQPSPNMPSLETATIYPGFGLIEGTNLSEGRGTTRPFEWIGAPWIDSLRLVKTLNGLMLPGVHFRSQMFRPTFSKYKGKICHGIQIHVVDRPSFHPLHTALAFLQTVMEIHPDKLKFEKGFDRLAGNTWLREALQRGHSVGSMMAKWEDDRLQFLKTRSKFLIYPAGN